MKLAYITPSEIPSKQANTVQAMKTCEAFASHGHDVELLCPNKSTATVDAFEYYGINKSFRIRRLPWQPFHDYQFTVLAAMQARRAGADLVYGRSIAGCYFSAILGLDVAYESHVPADNIQPITDRMFRSLITSERFAGLVVITEALKEYYTSKYDISNIVVAPDAAGPNTGTPIADIKQAENQQVGYVGHLYEGKGMSLIADLAREVPGTTFHIVGGTETDVQKWQSRTETLPNIIFHGHVPHNHVDDYLCSFDVLLAPYQRDVHGANSNTNLSQWMSPLKIFEYMSAGRPIICSNLSVLQEVLNDRENALLQNPDDLDEWIEALRELHEDSELYNKLVTNSTHDFEKQYSYTARAEKIIESLSS